MAKVGIVGMGYVGKGMLKLFDRGHDVTWYDPDPRTSDPNPFGVIGGRYSHQNRDIVQGVDLAVVCVPTPMKPDGSCDTSIVEEVCDWLDAPLVLIKSTVPPGTTYRLNARDKKFAWGRFHFSPEYMGEPRNFVPHWKYPDPRDPGMHDFVIVGGPYAGQVLDFFTPCMGPHTRYVPTSARTAELVKYMENAYFAMKVSFVTEFAKIAKLFDVNWHELRTLWQLDPRVEPDHTLVFPGDPGFGGKCLPKDVNALCSFVRSQGGAAHLMEAVLAINNIYRHRHQKTLDVQLDGQALYTGQQVREVVNAINEAVERDTPEGLQP